MSATIDHAYTNLHDVRAREHPGCVVCSPASPQGLQVRFEVLADGSTQGHFACGKAYEGYPGIIHGGVLSALLDGAMLHCLFARNQPAVTAELSVQFRHPVEVGIPVMVLARLIEQADSLYTLSGEVVQQGQRKVKATGRFLARTAILGRPEGTNGNNHDHNAHREHHRSS